MLLTYLVWWNKPQDVEEPLTIREERADTLLAFMCMNSKMGRLRVGKHIGETKIVRLHRNNEETEYHSSPWQFTSGLTYIEDVSYFLEGR